MEGLTTIESILECLVLICHTHPISKLTFPPLTTHLAWLIQALRQTPEINLDPIEQTPID